MAITVSGPTIIFDDTSVAQASLYNETFGTGVFPEGGTSLTIQGGTVFKSSATAGAGHIATVVGVKTDASVILETPQSGSVTVNPIVSGVYVFAIGGGGGGSGATASRIAGSNGTPSFFSTVIGNSGTGGSPGGTVTGGTGGTATGGTTNTSGTTAANRPGTGNGGNAGGFPGGLSGAGGDGAGPGSPGATPFPGPGLAGGDYGGGGGGAWNFLTGGAGGGGGGLAIHSRLTITGGSPYSYQAGAPGAGGPAPTSGGPGGKGYLKFVLYD